jgi:hypothetical protein
MKTVLRASTALIFGFLFIQVPFAAEVIVHSHKATLRADPSTEHPPRAILQPGEHLDLIDLSPKSGYYHVRDEDGEEGWVYVRSVEVVPDTPPGAQPAAAQPSAAPATAGGRPPSTTGIVSSIPTNWQKPAPNTTTFDGPDGQCGPSGDGGDKDTNTRKNRTDEPTEYHAVTWKALQTMTYPVAGKSLDTWTDPQKAQIQPYQGIAVTVVGYLAALKPQDHGSGESTNCHFTNAVEVDWHVALVEKAGDAEPTSIVVETTPRVRKNHPHWTPQALHPFVNSDAPVRISGWTLLDPEHRAHLGRYRSTLWEVHPITKIEVFKDGAWVDLDHLP